MKIGLMVLCALFVLGAITNKRDDISIRLHNILFWGVTALVCITNGFLSFLMWVAVPIMVYSTWVYMNKTGQSRSKQEILGLFLMDTIYTLIFAYNVVHMQWANVIITFLAFTIVSAFVGMIAGKVVSSR